jgi:hypothetical protein
VFRFGPGQGVRRVKVEALDPAPDRALYSLTLRLAFRAGVEVDVWLETASGSPLRVFDHTRPDECKRRGDRASCVVRYGLIPGNSPGVWTLFVRKLSRGPALVRVHAAIGSLVVGVG